jgi:PHD/YefM family antitoxin component YafN of YafNO toxin-antitoxin module
MHRISSKAAEKQFFAVLKNADEAPVIIERHGRARAAIVSISRFRLYEKLLAYFADEVAIEQFKEAADHAGNGRLGLAAKSRKAALRIAGVGVKTGAAR